MAVVTRQLCAAALLNGLYPAAVIAQNASPEASGTMSFAADYFAAFSPLTAFDMVEQVPSFSIAEIDNDVRGFGGAAGNVLINGERPSSKSNLYNFLSRIPATNVVRIDLVRGASGDLDMRGQTKVVNVITTGDATDAQTNWLVAGRQHRGGRGSVYAELTWAGRALGGDLSVTLPHEHWGVRPRREEQRFDGALTPIEYRYSEQQHYYREVIPAFEYERSLGEATTFRLNGRYWNGIFDLHRRLDVFDTGQTGPLTGIEHLDLAEKFTGFDVGGDIERDVTENLSTKLIWYNRRNTFESDEAFQVRAPDGVAQRTFVSDIEDRSGETILRTQTNWSPIDKHSIEFGLEGAYNFLEPERSFQEITSTGIGVAAVPQSPKVEEVRSEAFVSDVWTVSDKLTLEPGLKYEVSTIEQTGTIETSRTLRYPKPGLTVTWTPKEGRQFRFGVERKVAQLDFKDFTASVSTGDNQVTSGGRDLEPEQTWAFTSNYERSFLGDGVLTFVGSFDQVEQVQDFVPVTAIDPSCTDNPATAANECAFILDAPGNLGDGTRWVVGLDGSVPFTKFGLKNARFDFQWRTSSTSVDDPTTGQSRNFTDWTNHFYNFEFRHDLPELKVSWGFDYASDGSKGFFRRAEIIKENPGHGDLDVFVETTRFFDLNIKVGVDNVFDRPFHRDRRLFAPSRADGGQLIEIQDREETQGALAYIRLKGTF